MTTYTKITKASGTSYTKLSPPGDRYGYAKYGTGKYGNSGSTYTKVVKASGTSYTKIAKAT